MSVLIKGMEMPKDGCHHTICIYADGTVSTGGRAYMAVPVPPHGRLIDADALAQQIEYERFHHTHTDSLAARHHEAEYGHFLKAIFDAPTITPAEEGE